MWAGIRLRYVANKQILLCVTARMMRVFVRNHDARDITDATHHSGVQMTDRGLQECIPIRAIWHR